MNKRKRSNNPKQFQVSETAGLAMTTEFLLSCEDFADDDDAASEDLSYRFYYRAKGSDDEAWVYLDELLASEDDDLAVKLPAGEIELKADVCTALDACEETLIQETVTVDSIVLTNDKVRSVSYYFTLACE